ncbi:MAG: hypothetical protein WDZ72_05390 [Cyclobacteriaceae bacterium]
MKKPYSAQIFTAAIMVMLTLFAGISISHAQSNNPGQNLVLREA